MSKLTVSVLLFVLCVVTFMFGNAFGEANARQKLRAKQVAHDAAMREFGACEWVEAFAREVQCGAEQ